MTRAYGARRFGGTLSVLALAAISVSWELPLARVQAAVSALTAAATTQKRPSNQLTLEFEVPAEYWAKDPQGQFVVTGFLLGYFAPASTTPLHTFDVSRDRVSVAENVARIALPAAQPPLSVPEYVLRVQTVSRTGKSEWSDSSPRLYLLTPTDRSAKRASANTRKGRAAKKRGVSLEAIQQHPKLLAALVQLAPESAARNEAVAAYRTLEELATAVAICRQQELSFERLSKAVVGPPRRSLRRAATELKPSGRGNSFLRTAQAEAKQLLAEKSP